MTQLPLFIIPQSNTWTCNPTFARIRSRRFIDKSIVVTKLSDKKIAKFKAKF